MLEGYVQVRPNWNRSFGVLQLKAKVKHSLKSKAELLSKNIRKFYKQEDKFFQYRSIFYKLYITSKKVEESMKHSIKPSKITKYNWAKIIKSSLMKEESKVANLSVKLS